MVYNSLNKNLLIESNRMVIIANIIGFGMIFCICCIFVYTYYCISQSRDTRDIYIPSTRTMSASF